MADLRLDTNAEQILARFARLPQALQQAVARGLKRGLLLVEERVRAGASLRWRRGRGGLLGRLSSYVATNAGSWIEGAIGFRKTAGFPYEFAQEDGAVPRSAKALAIPITPEARRAGSPRQFPRRLFVPKGTHVLAEMLYSRARGMKGFIRDLVPHYVLVRSIPPRLRFRENVVAGLPELSREVVTEAEGAA